VLAGVGCGDAAVVESCVGQTAEQTEAENCRTGLQKH